MRCRYVRQHLPRVHSSVEQAAQKVQRSETQTKAQSASYHKLILVEIHKDYVFLTTDPVVASWRSIATLNKALHPLATVDRLTSKNLPQGKSKQSESVRYARGI